MEEGDGHPQGRRHDRAVRQLRRLRRRREWLKGPGRFSVRGPFCVMGRWCCCCAGFRVCVRRDERRAWGRRARRRGERGCAGSCGSRRRRAVKRFGCRESASGCRGASGGRVRLLFWLRFRGVRPCANGARRKRRTSRMREGPTWQIKRRSIRRAWCTDTRACRRATKASLDSSTRSMRFRWRGRTSTWTRRAGRTSTARGIGRCSGGSGQEMCSW